MAITVNVECLARLTGYGMSNSKRCTTGPETVNVGNGWLHNVPWF